MADALISPAVGGTMWVISAGAIGYCSNKVNRTLDDFKIPLMGVIGAFVFAAQMINFTIPGTGSSGHIVGALLLSILLGPYAALIVIASVLLVQALIFADGGLLSLGCNIFNMGIIPCLLAYPLLYRTISGKASGNSRIWLASIITAIVSLQFGALFVVLETWISGISELPFKGFTLLLLPIHLPIGLIEGIITASVLILIKSNRPELLINLQLKEHSNQRSYKNIIITFISASLLIGGVVSWFASENPDGLEWAIERTTTGRELNPPAGASHANAEKLQAATAILPEYGFKDNNNSKGSEDSSWGLVNLGTSISGIIGALLTLLLAFIVGLILKYKSGKMLPAEE
jgi:cobalt/nickel transport system permease protein